MSEIVDKKGVVPLKEIEAVALFYTRSFIGGNPYYICQVIGGTCEVMAQYTHVQLDELLDKENRGWHRELAALWREFRRNYGEPEWMKKDKPGTPVKLAKASDLPPLTSQRDKRAGKIIH